MSNIKLLTLLGLFLLVLTDYTSARGLFAPTKDSGVGTSRNIDVGYGFATESITDYAYKFGIANVGYGFDLYNFSNAVVLQGRFDISYYSFENSAGESFNRIPFFLGLRPLIPITKYIILYLEAGLEVSYDKQSTTSAGFASDETGLNFGFMPGVGLEYHIPIGTPDPILEIIGEMSDEHVTRMVIGFNFRYHTLTNPYFSMAPYIGLRW